jgi:hypothetical protein
MKTKTETPGPWHDAKMGNDHQGLVIDDKTGANIAVAYDKAHARLLAAAPDLLDVAREALDCLETVASYDHEEIGRFHSARERLRAAIDKAEDQGGR